MHFHNYIIQSPTQISQTKLGIPLEYKQQCIEEIYKIGDTEKSRSNVKAIMSSFHIWKQSPIFNLLLDKILNTINTYFPPSDSQYEYYIKEAWSATYKNNQYTQSHNHLPSQLSFTYYFQTTGNTPIIFDECNFKIIPLEDMLLIFPSYLIHSVPKHKDKKDRICLAGNINLKPIK